MDLNQLKSFVAVAHQGNLTQAAETLHLSQPAVSAQIKAIETHLNVSLFQRNPQGMALTRSGEALLPQAEALLQHMRRLDQFAAGLSETYVNELQLGLIDALSGERLAALTQAVLQTDPNVQLHFHFDLSGNIINAVRKKEMVAGFFVGENPYRNVCSIFLEQAEYILICPQAWESELAAPAADLSSQYKRLKSKNWLMMSEASGSAKLARRMWREWHINPPHSVICDKTSALVDLVAAGLGVALIPRRDADWAFARQKAVAALDFTRQWLPLSFIYAREYELDPTVEILKNAIAATWLK